MEILVGYDLFSHGHKHIKILITGSENHLRCRISHIGGKTSTPLSPYLHDSSKELIGPLLLLIADSQTGVLEWCVDHRLHGLNSPEGLRETGVRSFYTHDSLGPDLS